MKPDHKYNAPWGRTLGLTTSLALTVCIGTTLIGALVFPEGHPGARLSMFILPLLLLLGGAAFMVRGYTLRNDTLIIHRLGWTSRLDLSSLISAAPDPAAMEGAIRLAGNGGLFSISGWFSNQKLGRYRVFGTDPRRSVILRFPSQVVVVTPDAPEKFVSEIMARN
jgi:hypothetical protein